MSKIIHLGTWARYIDADIIDAKHENKPVSEMIDQMGMLNKATVMVTGFNGRKGPKANHTVLGTQIEYLANQRLPLLIVKDPIRRADKPDGLFHYGVCYDSSD